VARAQSQSRNDSLVSVSLHGSHWRYRFVPVQSAAFPSISFYILFHMLLFTVNEFVIIVAFWNLHQIERFKVAWQLVFDYVTIKRLLKTQKGDSGPYWILMYLLSWALRGIAFTNAFYSDWHGIYTSVGSFSCTAATYSPELGDKIQISPNVVSGDIDFAQVYMYGLPFSDGIATAFAPWPNYSPGNFI
jgi:hypothetical protein